MTDANRNPLTRPPATLSPPAATVREHGGSDGERDGVRGIVSNTGVISEGAALTETAVLDALRQVIDPEIGMSIVDLGLIYHVAIENSRVQVAMTLTSAGCPMSESIRSGAEIALLNLAGVAEAQVELVFDPPWHPGIMLASAAPRTA